jgi:hypothetical protein
LLCGLRELLDVVGGIAQRESGLRIHPTKSCCTNFACDTWAQIRRTDFKLSPQWRCCIDAGAKNRGDGMMPYHIRAGSIRAIASDERQALELHRRLSGLDREEVSITDIFGGEIDAAKLEARASTQKV